MQKIIVTLLVFVLFGCSENNELPQDIKPTQITWHETQTGEFLKAPVSNILTPLESKRIKQWLDNSTPNWSSHNPMTTQMPDWCITLISKRLPQDVGLCRYAGVIVLRTKKQIEKPITSHDATFFPKLSNTP